MSKLKFTLGADPEFNLESDGKQLHAEKTITAIFGKNKKYKSHSSGGYKIEKTGGIGWDGHSETGEIRPDPANTPEGIVANLQELFNIINKEIPSAQITTLSKFTALGGHIHFEIPSKTEGKSPKMELVHKKLVSYLLPITLGENKINILIRNKSNYGYYCSNNAFRVENHFTKPNGEAGYTYELRIPSAEWITTPKIAKATLAYLACVYNEIINNPQNFNEKSKEIQIRTNKIGDAIQALALTEYKLLTNVLFAKIKENIKSFELYEEYKEDIEYILNPEQVLKDKIDINYNICKGWNLKEKEEEANKKDILSEKKFIEIAKTKDLESMGKLITIDYNNDLNVKIFIDILQQKMAAFNWKLNKQYFFFGIRKGIDGYIIMDKDKKIIQGLEMAKTTSDKKTIEKIITNMYDKYMSEASSDIKTEINFATGKIEKTKKDIVIMGIPYNERVKLNTKNFIETVYNTDKNQIKEITRKEELINDDDKPEKEKGEIYKIVNNPETDKKIETVETSGEDARRIESIVKDIERGGGDEDF